MLFNIALNDQQPLHETEEGEMMALFVVRLAKTDPPVFNKSFWTENKLRKNLLTNPQVGVYALFGAPWKTHKTFEKLIKERGIYERTLKEDKDKNYLSILAQPHCKRAAAFNMWSRDHITFVKFKSSLFEADSRAERVKEFTKFMVELLKTVWEADSRTLLIP